MSQSKSIHSPRIIVAAAALLAAIAPAAAQVVQGPSSSRTPYLVPSGPANTVTNVTSIVTTLDLVPLTGSPATPYEICGILDGLGAYDNGDGTITVLANHELGANSGAIRRHGARGAFVAEIVVDKNTLQVVSAQDLIHTVVDVNGVDRNAANNNGLALNRFCSADLADPTAYYNPATGRGTQERIFFNGEEGGATGYAVATVATGPNKGRAWLLPKFNVATTFGGTTVGAWENICASPFAQDKTVVVGLNDGGTNEMDNRVTVYVGQKQSTGNEIERAGLFNGTSYFVNVIGNPVEIVNSTTRATNITSGTRFTLVTFSPTSTGTEFSRPEDGAWDPTNPRDFYFVTTDRIDTATSTGFNQTIGTSATQQVGMSRLWRLRFDNITNPLAGGVIDLVVDGSKNDQKVNMLDNMAVGGDGMVYLTEDPGNNVYLARTWAYDPTTDTMVQLVKMDPVRWGELAVNGGTPGATAPHNNNKEISGVIDVTDLFPHAADERVLLIDVQDHSNNPAVANANTVEGGQLLLMKVSLRARSETFGQNCNGLTLAADASPAILGRSFTANVGGIDAGQIAFLMLGTSNTSFQGGALPLDLAFANLPGCFLLQNASLSTLVPTTSTGPSTARFALLVPPAFGFAGFPLHLQAWSSSLQLSNGLTAVFGF